MARYMREQWLADLANREKFSTFVELGVWNGRTFFHMLDNCPKLTVWGVDEWIYRPGNTAPGGETYEHWNMPGLHAHVTGKAQKYGSRARILRTDTVAASELFEDESVDCVFVDADHSEMGCWRDLAAWVPKVKTGGFVTGHDIDWPTVKSVVTAFFGEEYRVAVDNVWWTRKS